jgi:hypothetical protein
MSLLTDLFVAEPSAALSYEERLKRKDLSAYDRAEFKGLTGLEFSTLRAFISNEEWDLDKHDLEEVTPSGETWLFRFPERFVDQLSELGSADIPDLSKQWAATEELQWEPAEAEEVIVALVRLARKAKLEAKGLYLWGSL